ncbi:unnamed protein product [Diatraea saccharalis]|uniref:FATC domain-containing protein n=1 Tax=Diatraea saccharalis TaxID=40085 RepID=A0A9N9RCY2_9NEOP|nr:unnamed protein product [Diatraea saccharalis]
MCILTESHYKYEIEHWFRLVGVGGGGTSVGVGGGGGGGGGGARSAQGAGVWRRVRLKLEGRDTHARHLIHEQVEYIISEATSAENLCLMYEGWMAWV